MSEVVFSTDQYPGAFLNGTRVAKTQSKPGDAHQDGSEATVIGSVGQDGLVGYFVHWDDMPDVPVFVAEYRLEKINS